MPRIQLAQIVSTFSLAASVGCYSTTPIESAGLRPAMDVVIDMTDRGTAELASAYGTGIIQIRGRIVEAREDSTKIAVASVLRIRGAPESWNNSVTMFPTSAFGRYHERRLDRRKSIFAGILTTVAVVLVGKALGLDGILLGAFESTPAPPE